MAMRGIVRFYSRVGLTSIAEVFQRPIVFLRALSEIVEILPRGLPSMASNFLFDFEQQLALVQEPKDTAVEAISPESLLEFDPKKVEADQEDEKDDLGLSTSFVAPLSVSSLSSPTTEPAQAVPVLLGSSESGTALAEVSGLSLSESSQTAGSPIAADTFGVPVAAVAVGATGDNNIDGLLSGVRWASGSISFSFTDSIDDYEGGYANRASHGASFQTLNATQRDVARRWIGSGGEYYDVGASISPFELTGASDRDATIRMAMSDVPGTAFAYYPNSSIVEGGDAWFNRVYYNSPVIGNYAYYTFGHELGHALGLKHGHELGGPANVSMNADRDSMEFSIMTYRSYIGAPTDFVYNEAGGFAQSLMMYDIEAIQHMYGAYFGNNSGNTAYTFSTTTGEMFVDGIGQGTPVANRVFRTIWDGNGVDTYDFSNYSTNLSVDLTPGGWSDLDVGGTFQKAYLGGGNFARGHVFNALQYQGDARSLIENANGGSGNDRMLGNSANNVLNGNSGNDTVDGGSGDDLILLGAGNDYLNIVSGGSDTFYGGTGDDYIYGWTGNETYFGEDGNDNLLGYSGNDNINGGTGNDYIDAGEGDDAVDGGEGNDLILLGGGNDYLNIVSGGSDTFYGGSGDDYIYGYTGNETYFGEDGNDTLLGSSGNDLINGGSGVDSTNGFGDNDRIIDDDLVTFDVHNGGDGTDTIDYSPVTFADGFVTINLATGITSVSGGNTETIGGFENVDGSQGGETIIGNTLNNVLRGNGGNDTIDGSSGNDTLDGGSGIDTVVFGSANNTVNFLTGQATGDGNDRLSNFENAVGGDGNDNLVGSTGDNLLDGGNGNDTVTGGAGNDNLIGGAGTDTAVFGTGASTLNLTTGQATGGGVGTDTLNGIENLAAGAGNDTLTGSGGNNLLDGGGDNDTINGAAGSDNLIGGTGNDSMLGGSGNDTLTGGGDGQIDVLTSGNTLDLDRFVLGTAGVAGQILYDTNLNRDYARITDFDLFGLASQVDRIQLRGTSGGYRLANVTLGAFSGAGIYDRNGTVATGNDDLIGLIQGLSSTNFNLTNTNQFIYVV
jgi:serralysin